MSLKTNVAALIVVIAVKVIEGNAGNNKGNCRRIAKELRETIDENVNPCDNFYRFACGKWIESHSIPDDKPLIDNFNFIENKTNEEIIELLEGDFTFGEASDKLRSQYKGCRDTDTIEYRGSAPLKDVLTKFGGWPVIAGERWDAESFDWDKTLVKLRNNGYNHRVLMIINVDSNTTKNTENIVNLYQADLALPNKNYYNVNNLAYNAYFSLMVKCAQKLGADNETALSDMRDVLQLETQLAEISVPPEDLRNSEETNNLFTKASLIEKYSNLKFEHLLDRITKNTIDENELVNVIVPKFFDALNKLLSKVNKRTLANYLLWRVVFSSLPHLSSDWKHLNLEFDRELYGVKDDTPRPMFCVDVVTANLHMALTSLYVQRNPKKYRKIKKRAKLMFEELLKTVRQEIIDSEWIQPQTKQSALRKLDSLITVIGFPDEYFKPNVINEYFSTLKLTGNYYEDFFLTNAFSTDKEMEILREPNIRDDWKKLVNMLAANAYNNSYFNVIMVLLGILRGFLFSENSSLCRNVAALGSIIGHEISHGFDDMGRQFDEHGNLRNWWDNETSQAYIEKQKCVIEMYDKFYVPEVNKYLNGEYSQGENIADIGGSKSAFHTFQRIRKQCKRCPRKYVKYTKGQLFWIHYAMVWCTKETKEYTLKSVLSNPHSPPEFRVNGPLSSNPEFAKSFKCPEGSPMNPEKKCSFW